MIGAVDESGKLLAFTHAGTIQQAEFEFGRWLDLGVYPLLLTTPTAPVDG